MKDTGYTVAKRIPPGYHVLTGQKGPVRLVYHCPPDTVDPRGPKGK